MAVFDVGLYTAERAERDWPFRGRQG